MLITDDPGFLPTVGLTAARAWFNLHLPKHVHLLYEINLSLYYPWSFVGGVDALLHNSFISWRLSWSSETRWYLNKMKFEFQQEKRVIACTLAKISPTLQISVSGYLASSVIEHRALCSSSSGMTGNLLEILYVCVCVCVCVRAYASCLISFSRKLFIQIRWNILFLSKIFSCFVYFQLCYFSMFHRIFLLPMSVPFLFSFISLRTVETVVALYGISASPFFHALGKAREAMVLS